MNEEGTVTACERTARHDEAQPQSAAVLEKALGDERRHRDRMHTIARSL